MERLDLLQQLIINGHSENRADHERIAAHITSLESQIVSIRLWRAKVIGIGAAISVGISAASVLAGHFMAWMN